MYQNNLYKILLNDKKVNSYTKILIILNMLAYNQDYYIPNKKILNICKKNNIKINSIRGLNIIIKELQNSKIINLFYKGNKRYFNLNYYNNIKKNTTRKLTTDDDYDWLGDD